MTIHKPLTINQVTALSELHTRGNLARSALMATIGIGHNTMATLVEALEFHGYVIDGETHSGTRWKLLSITMVGRRALAAHQDGELRRKYTVQPARINRLAGFYVPPARGYCRNNGNVHFPSRGVAC